MHAGNVDETSNPAADIALNETDDEVSNPIPNLAAGVTLTKSECVGASSVMLPTADPELAHTEHLYSNPEIVEKINSVFHEDDGGHVPVVKMEAFDRKLAAEWSSDEDSMDCDFAWSPERESDVSALSGGTSVLEGVFERSTNLPQPLQLGFNEHSSHVQLRPPERVRPRWLHLRSGGEANIEVTASHSHSPYNQLGPRSPVPISTTPKELQIISTHEDLANEATTSGNRTVYPVPEDVVRNQTHYRTPPVPNYVNHSTLPPDKS